MVHSPAGAPGRAGRLVRYFDEKGDAMALPHAGPGQVIDVRPLGAALGETKTHMLAKTDDVEILRLVLPAGKELPMHVAPGVLVVQCVEGRVEFSAFGKTADLEPGRLVYLPPKEPHAVRAVQPSSLLVTILRRTDEA
jgi:quercetin dioxygenase-like cupin family protein